MNLARLTAIDYIAIDPDFIENNFIFLMKVNKFSLTFAEYER